MRGVAPARSARRVALGLADGTQACSGSNSERCGPPPELNISVNLQGCCVAAPTKSATGRGDWCRCDIKQLGS